MEVRRTVLVEIEHTKAFGEVHAVRHRERLDEDDRLPGILSISPFARLLESG